MRGFCAEGVAEFGAQAEVVAEVVAERAPAAGVDVPGTGHHDARVGVDLENPGLERLGER